MELTSKAAFITLYILACCSLPQSLYARELERSIDVHLRRLQQTSGSSPVSSPGNAQNSSQCATEVNAYYNGTTISGDSSFTVASVGECCQKCQGNSDCNAFVYCGIVGGCMGPSITAQYQQCDLKSIDLGGNLSNIEASRVSNVNFTSGLALPPALAPSPLPSRLVSKEILAPLDGPADPVVLSPGSAASPLNGTSLSNVHGCTMEIANYQGDRTKSLQAIRSAAACCLQCQANDGCNIFTYCGDPDGCYHSGAREKYGQCDLKIQANTTIFNVAVWSRGPDSNFTSGFCRSPSYAPVTVVDSVVQGSTVTEKGKTHNEGAIIGGVLGAVAGVLLLALAAFIFYHKRRARIARALRREKSVPLAHTEQFSDRTSKATGVSSTITNPFDAKGTTQTSSHDTDDISQINTMDRMLETDETYTTAITKSLRQSLRGQ